MEVCDLCDEILTEQQAGIAILGENIAVRWVGKSSVSTDVFENNGQYAPMNGRVSLTICKKCLKLYLKL